MYRPQSGPRRAPRALKSTCTHRRSPVVRVFLRLPAVKCQCRYRHISKSKKIQVIERACGAGRQVTVDPAGAHFQARELEIAIDDSVGVRVGAISGAYAPSPPRIRSYDAAAIACVPARLESGRSTCPGHAVHGNCWRPQGEAASVGWKVRCPYRACITEGSCPAHAACSNLSTAASSTGKGL